MICFDVLRLLWLAYITNRPEGIRGESRKINQERDYRSYDDYGGLDQGNGIGHEEMWTRIQGDSLGLLTDPI